MKTISFDAISIQAILTGKKTMTRRPIKDMPKARWEVGDVAWVRTGWTDDNGKKHPAIFMPKSKSPFSIMIIAHGIHLLWEITPHDIEKEGIDIVSHLPMLISPDKVDKIIDFVAKQLFSERWDSIYGGTIGKQWENNPIVEVLTFKIIDTRNEPQ